VAAARSDAFKLTPRAVVLWRGEEIACLEAGEDLLKPSVILMADEHMSAPDKEKVQERLNAWIAEIIGERLKPLVDLGQAKDVAGLARGIAFRLSENLGILRRDSVAEEVRALDQPARAQLRGYGVRFGAFNIYFPALLKPAAVELALTLWLLKHGAESGLDPANAPTLPRPGLTSLPVDNALPPAFYRVAGFHPCGVRAVRIDMLERLADLIRPLVAWRPDPANAANPAPKGATGDGGFRVTSDMMSILGCSSSNVGEVLQELGFRLERVPVRDVRPEDPAGDAPTTASEAAPTVPEAPATVESPSSAAPSADLGAVAGASSPEAAVGAQASEAAGAGAAPAPETLFEEAPAEAAPAAGEDACAVETAAAAGDAPAPGDGAVTIVAGGAGPPPPPPGGGQQGRDPPGEEIWRPRRQGRHHDRERGRRRGGPPPPSAEAAKPAGEARENGHQRGNQPHDGRSRRHDRSERQERHQRPDRHDRPDRAQGRPDRKERRHGPGRREGGREDRQPRVYRHSASPAPKPGVDPDSPFAALSSLKAALEKQSQE
jgi:ATP-dependent RNA helicase SUPV3L1/SUV3